jgi:hypothetical protein
MRLASFAFDVIGLGHVPTIGIIIQDASEQIRWGFFEGGIGFQGRSFPFIAARELPAQ